MASRTTALRVPRAERAVVRAAVAAPYPRWHVSPWVDMLGYHWSWVPPLCILFFVGDRFPVDYTVVLLATWGLNFSHQAISLAFVYLDKDVFAAERRRFTVAPLAFLALFLATVALLKTVFVPFMFTPWGLAVTPAALLLLVQLDAVLRDGRPLPTLMLWAVGGISVIAPLLHVLHAGSEALVHGPVLLVGIAATSVALAVASQRRRAPNEPMAPWLRVREQGVAPVLVVIAVLAFALPLGPAWPSARTSGRALLPPIYALVYIWNFWHVYMQKYGILRLYAAKSGVPEERRPPGFADRFLVFGWLPLIVVVAGLRYASLAGGYFTEVRTLVNAIHDVLVSYELVLVPTGVVIAAASCAVFLFYERRASRLRNWPRLSAAAALVLLSMGLLVGNPVKVAIAFGISHTIEYFVFVWAWQRRKFGSPQPEGAPKRSLMGTLMRRPTLAVFGFMALASLFWVVGNEWGRTFGLRTVPHFLGLPPHQWLTAFSSSLALCHFYFDGFLWKMRKASVRNNL